jgi:hypothetical protein
MTVCLVHCTKRDLRHLRPAAGVREVAEQMLEEDGRSGLFQIQVSENVPREVWRTSYPAIADAIDAFARTA